MPHAEHSVTVERPIDQVFAFLADGENDPRWRSGVLDIERVAGEGVGAQYRQGVKGPMGRRVAADDEVTEFVPRGRWASAPPQAPCARGPLRARACRRRHRRALRPGRHPDRLRAADDPQVARTMRTEVQAIDRLPAAMGA